jgi:hypothetical protein
VYIKYYTAYLTGRVCIYNAQGDEGRRLGVDDRIEITWNQREDTRWFTPPLPNPAGLNDLPVRGVEPRPE